MKTKLSVLILFLIIITNISKAQISEKTTFKPPVVSPHILKPQVTNITLAQDSVRPAGNAQAGYYNATIHSTGIGMVQYQWVMIAVNQPPNGPAPHIINDSILLGGTGIDHVYHKVSISAHSGATLQLRTTAPDVVFSNKELY